ncbi:type II toxin-antitoxin system antitoxin SocA domain-containing protein [Streptosporangium sp. NPDC002524]|uniref:Panacea domain-containing protein n=1 Tax=Streptosporangium sp. NPDC002524 TaxID=3154537 RepID=UPI0033194209
MTKNLHPTGHETYPDAMPASAHAVASALRERLPGLTTKKLHKLLYYCQGHHLAAFGKPLFSETISAWDMGPVVGSLWREEKDSGPGGIPVEGDPPPLGESELNTIGYVISRYGALSGQDLEHLTHSESPWQRADSQRRPRESARIEPAWIEEYFASAAGDEDDDVVLDSDEVTKWLSDAKERLADPLQPDDLDALRAKLAARG